MRLAAFCLAALLAACVHQPAARGPDLARAPLPQPRVGDSLAWDRGYSETVVAVRGELVEWRYDNGNTFTAYRNPLLPPVGWDNPDSRASAEVAAPADLLFPLAPGAEVRFRVLQRMTRKVHDSESVYDDEWGCRVLGTERVTVPVGSFDTYALRCRLYWSGSIIDQAELNYAPSIGQVVRRRFGATDEFEQLVGYSPGGLPAAAADLAAAALHQALETVPAGRTLESRSGEAAAAITPKATFRTAKAAWCREFLQVAASGGLEARRAAIACRDAKGRWVVP